VAAGHAVATGGHRGCQLRLEALPVAELDELGLLDGPSEGLLLRQVRQLVLLHREHRRLHDLLRDLLLFLLLFLRQRWHPVRHLLLRVRIRVVVILGIAE
jgi:hypothetical protein